MRGSGFRNYLVFKELLIATNFFTEFKSESQFFYGLFFERQESLIKKKQKIRVKKS